MFTNTTTHTRETLGFISERRDAPARVADTHTHIHNHGATQENSCPKHPLSASYVASRDSRPRTAPFLLTEIEDLGASFLYSLLSLCYCRGYDISDGVDNRQRMNECRIQRMQQEYVHGTVYIVPRTGVADTCQTHYGQSSAIPHHRRGCFLLVYKKKQSHSDRTLRILVGNAHTVRVQHVRTFITRFQAAPRAHSSTLHTPIYTETLRARAVTAFAALENLRCLRCFVCMNMYERKDVPDAPVVSAITTTVKRSAKALGKLAP